MKFIVYGEPVAKGRPRFARRGNFIATYSPQKTVDYENLIKQEFKKQCKPSPDYDGGITLKVEIYYEPPKSTSKKKYEQLLNKGHFKKPDIDNIIKAISDGLNGLAYKDDSQIYYIIASKRYSDKARVEIEIEYKE